MFKLDERRAVKEITIQLQMSDGTRLTGSVQPTTTLQEMLTSFEQQTNSKFVASPDSVPICSYMSEEVNRSLSLSLRHSFRFEDHRNARLVQHNSPRFGSDRRNGGDSFQSSNDQRRRSEENQRSDRWKTSSTPSESSREQSRSESNCDALRTSHSSSSSSPSNDHRDSDDDLASRRVLDLSRNSSRTAKTETGKRKTFDRRRKTFLFSRNRRR